MSAKYRIHVVNDSASTQTFWLFLSKPEGLESEQVYAKSNTFMTVRPRYQGYNYFTIQVQYIVEVGVSDYPIEVGFKIFSSVIRDTPLGAKLNVQHADPALYKGPMMTDKGRVSNANQIWMDTLPYKKEQEAASSWYANQSFGIHTDHGFTGMTWSPTVGRSKLTPKPTFYVAVGPYRANELTSWEQVLSCCATVAAPADFDTSNQATVRYTSSGGWIAAPGKPQKQCRPVKTKHSPAFLFSLEGN